ncbi:hypothetical protein SAMN00120144_1832 [Hymenobacter roseosalivarius DSM 11622]|uniref:Uncharacterized protein n=1 Tax=Hymenobacter roseosalivarius DSM 11622 TaxID=645990 RepID=A0A1W1VZV5_9BACT|nr:hypothetical protein SAMN00120144_1832 [Hymenobacter roseosalivarius DSM 11622]
MKNQYDPSTGELIVEAKREIAVAMCLFLSSCLTIMCWV